MLPQNLRFPLSPQLSTAIILISSQTQRFLDIWWYHWLWAQYQPWVIRPLLTWRSLPCPVSTLVSTELPCENLLQSRKETVGGLLWANRCHHPWHSALLHNRKQEQNWANWYQDENPSLCRLLPHQIGVGQVPWVTLHLPSLIRSWGANIKPTWTKIQRLASKYQTKMAKFPTKLAKHWSKQTENSQADVHKKEKSLQPDPWKLG